MPSDNERQVTSVSWSIASGSIRQVTKLITVYQMRIVTKRQATKVLTAKWQVTKWLLTRFH